MESNIIINNRNKKRETVCFLALFILLILAVYFSVSLGTVKFTPKRLIEMMFNSSSMSTIEKNILLKIRLPRVAAAVIFGTALSLSGYLLQVFFRNPIAGPYVLGISSGAKLFVGIIILTNIKFFSADASLWGMFIASALGSIFVMMLVLAVSRKIQSISVLLVVGIMIGYIAQAFTNLLIAFASENKIAGLATWSLGSFSGINWQMIKISLMIIIPVIAIAYIFAGPLELYLFGENYAKSMGVNIKRFRVMLIMLSSLLSAVVTAFAGPISFVGIAVPHIAKQLFKSSKARVLIPGIILLGSVFCLFSDLVARTIFSPVELNISTVTSFVGAPVVIYLLIRRKKN